MFRTTIGGTQFIGRLLGDFSGVAVASAGDANNDGFVDFLIGAPLTDRLNDNGSLAGQNAGAAMLVYGTGAELPQVVDLTDLNGTNGVIFREIGDEFAEFGTSVAGLGDFNGDGFDDILIGAPFRSRIEDQNTGEGAAYIRFGAPANVTATVSTPSISGGSGFKIIGSDPDSFLGLSVSRLGDFNGDGLADAVIGMVGLGNADDLGTGGALVIFGSSAAIPGFPETSDAVTAGNGVRIVGAAVGDYAGVSVASAGDFNGDGFDDLLIGATGATGGEAESGAAFVVFGSATPPATINLSSLNGTNGIRLNGVLQGDRTGIAGASLGDVNGDGLDDILIGADESGGSGRAYVVFGRSGSQPADLALGALNGANGFRIDGLTVSDSLGTAVSAAGDVNGDGIADILVGALSANPFGETSAGEVYLIFGKSTGFNAVVSPASLDGRNGFLFAGEFTQDVAGSALSAAGDVNGDGFDDFFIGAPGGDVAGDLNAGITYLIYGGLERLLAQDALDGDLDGVIDLRGLGDAIMFWSGAATRGTDATETLTGGTGAEALFGMDGHDQLLGNGGDDFLDGGAGNDRITGGAGIDSVLGGAGNDVIRSGGGNDLIECGAGDDVVRAFTGNDSVAGGDGADNIAGSTGNDTLSGDDGDDLLRGEDGQDRLDGGAGIDRLFGGAGNDSLTGGDGADDLRGDAGNDRLDGGDGDDTLFGGLGDDSLQGGIGIDTLRGDDGIDRLDGGVGDDSLFGGAGADSLLGGDGNDVLRGEADIDRIEGGAGNDSLFGGLGADVFVFRAGFGSDQIGDFNFVSERLDFSLHSGVDRFADLTLTEVAGSTVISDGEGGSLTLVGVALNRIDATDFLF